MAKSVDDITIDAIKQGGILCLLYFDIHGNEKDALQKILVGFVGKISKEHGVIYSYGEIDEPIEFDGMHSASAEVKLLVKNYQSLQALCARYGPVGLEILRPNEIKLTVGEAQSVLMDVAMLSQDFVKAMMEKTMTPEEKAHYEKKMTQRAELGKKLLDRKDENKG